MDRQETKKTFGFAKKKWGKRLLAGILAGAMLLLSAVGCSSPNDVTSGAGTSDFPVTINGVTISSEPEGVAVLSPNLAEVVLAMGYEIKLKARSADCTNEELSVLPAVSPEDPEGIKATGASLVLGDEALTEEQVNSLTQAGLTVLVIPSAKDRQDLSRLYAQTGAALKGGSTGYTKGEKTADNILITLDDIQRAVGERETVTTACYLVDLQGTAITGDSMQSRLFELAGLSNIAAGSENGQLTDSVLNSSDPNYIFCITGLKDAILTSEKYAGLTAVQQGKVYEMPYDYIAYQGRGMIQACSFMAGTVYPELLENNSVSSVPPEEGSSSEIPVDPSGYTTLKSGDSGEAVTRLQERLAELGYFYVNPTGNYLDVTVQCVKDFQLLNNMAATGIADPETQALLFSDEAIPRPESNS